MINENFVFVGVLVSTIFALPYILGTLKGDVKPNKATWLLLSVAPLLAVAGEINEGVGLRSVTTFMAGFIPFCIFLASFVNKKAYWKLTNIDYVFATLSVVGIVLFLVSDNGKVAILFGLLADALAFTPTIIKGYRYPETENFVPFVGGIITSTIGLLILDVPSFAGVAFPVYLVAANLIMIYGVAIRPKIMKTQKEAKI